MKILGALLFGSLLFFGCGDKFDNQSEKEFKHLSKEEKDYIERFNAKVKEIRDFPPKIKNLQKYFHIIKSVSNLEDARVIFFPERHTHELNQLWSAGALDKLVKPGDAVLFEGASVNRKFDVEEQISTGIFAVREYEKLKSQKQYNPQAISKIQNKYANLFFKTINFLALNELNLKAIPGFGWDSAASKDLSIRNQAMVFSITQKLKEYKRVFVFAGSLHIPHYEFADRIELAETLYATQLTAFTTTPGANRNEINDVFYNFFEASPNVLTKPSTKSIFDFMKTNDFAILIPKNLPRFKELESYLPQNVR